VRAILQGEHGQADILPALAAPGGIEALYKASPDIRIRFGRAIRRIREEQKINQEEAAKRCGLHRTYYSGVERGVRNVSLVNIEKIARGLKKALHEIFGRV
jgi:DNA-binding XRE family transcriptional regulator